MYLMQEERRPGDAVNILPTGAFLRYQMTGRKIIDRITAAKTGCTRNAAVAGQNSC